MKVEKKIMKITAQKFIGLDSLYTYYCCRKVQIFITLYVRVLILPQCINTGIFSLLILGVHTEMFKELEFLTLKWVGGSRLFCNKQKYLLFSLFFYWLALVPCPLVGKQKQQPHVPCNQLKCLEQMEAPLCERLGSQNLFA